MIARVYRPLIEKTPSDQSTVLTAMTDTEQIFKATEQDNTNLTSDQQLYRVKLEVMLFIRRT